MVIIGVGEGYRGVGLVAMTGGVWRSAGGCGERVEGRIYAGIAWVLGGWVWKSFVPRGTF